MEVEKDLILREIQKLSLFLTSLIEKIGGLNSNNAISGIEEINVALKSEFDLTLRDLTQMENFELVKQVEKLYDSHTEKLAELMFEIVMKTELPDLSEDYDKMKIAQKAILLIDFLNEKSNTFSMKRMNIKNALQHRLSENSGQSSKK